MYIKIIFQYKYTFKTLTLEIMNYQDLFPKHRLNKQNFVDDLIKLQEERDSSNIVSYWKSLDNEGNMFNINRVFESSLEIQEKIKYIIYSFAEFMTKSDFVEFKKMLGVYGHILEFVHAILSKPTPNYGIIEYFVMVAKSPRHYDPQTIQWFWENVTPLIDHEPEVKKQFLENCSNSIHRWIKTQKKNKNYKNQFEEQKYTIFGDNQIPMKLISDKNKTSGKYKLNNLKRRN